MFRVVKVLNYTRIVINVVYKTSLTRKHCIFGEEVKRRRNTCIFVRMELPREFDLCDFHNLIVSQSRFAYERTAKRDKISMEPIFIEPIRLITKLYKILLIRFRREAHWNITRINWPTYYYSGIIISFAKSWLRTETLLPIQPVTRVNISKYLSKDVLWTFSSINNLLIINLLNQLLNEIL